MRIKNVEILVVGVILTMLGGCSAMLLGEAGGENVAIGSDNRSSAQIAADSNIADAVTAALEAEPSLDAANIAISAKNGVVTLAGSVNSFKLRDRAVKVAGAVSGVARVSNQLQVNTNG